MSNVDDLSSAKVTLKTGIAVVAILGSGAAFYIANQNEIKANAADIEQLGQILSIEATAGKRRIHATETAIDKIKQSQSELSVGIAKLQSQNDLVLQILRQKKN